MTTPSAATPPDTRESTAACVVFADASALGLIAIEGSDAAAFLQGQLSNDVLALAPGEGQWTSYNSPKGRMLATMFLWRLEGAEPLFRAIVAADLAEALRKRLAMFVLRSKVGVADLTDAHAFLGLGGPGAADAVRGAFGAVPAPGKTSVVGATSMAHWPDGRLGVIVPRHGAESTGRRSGATN